MIFENTRWSEVAEKGLLTEIPEQILEDGANFELSPMYHSLILIDMLDMLNLKKAYPTRISNELTSLIEEYIPKMLVFMEAMAHPDDGLSFFNDSVNGIAPPKARIKKYAEKLGFDINSYDLIGWQTEDIYQNLVVTYIYNIEKNNVIKKKYFQLPPLN